MQLSIILARTNQGRFAKHTNKTHSPDKPARERERVSLFAQFRVRAHVRDSCAERQLSSRRRPSVLLQQVSRSELFLRPTELARA